MSRILSEDDIEAIALRVVSIMSERLAAPRPTTVPQPAPEGARAVPPPLQLSYTRSQLCKELSLSADTLYKLENQGLLRPLPGIRHKIYSRAEVERFLSSAEAKWRPTK